MKLKESIKKLVPDRIYLQILYNKWLGKRLDLKNPKTFNEKVQWIKLYDRNPLYTTLVDKYAVREYIKEKVGEEYLIPLVGGPWMNANDIDFGKLPNQFVLKCNHDSGSVIICHDKETFDIAAAREKLNKALKTNFYYWAREWAYKNVKPCIIAEKYMAARTEGRELAEYKFFCFNGRPQFVLVCRGQGHSDERTNDIYDIDFHHIPVTLTYPNIGKDEKKPEQYESMTDIVKMLSEGIPQVRVDLYLINRKIYFGEMTFYHDSGFCWFNPDTYDMEFGKYILLPSKREDSMH